MKQSHKALVWVAFVALLSISIYAFPQGRTSPSTAAQHSIHDGNGDGICDICGQPAGIGRTHAQGTTANNGKHFGPGNGTGNAGSGPRDGTGYGVQSGKRLGPQDGTRPGMNSQVPGAGGGQGGSRRGGRP
jgi:hypothetical protein